MEVRPQNFIQIQGWMVLDLKLKGNELLLYALIYGFSQDGRSMFDGSLKYIREWLGCAKQTAVNTIKSLQKKGLITKSQYEKDGVAQCRYMAIVPDVLPMPEPELRLEVTPKQERTKETMLSEKAQKLCAGFSPALNRAVKDWRKYKEERKDRYTPTGADKLIAQIANAASKYGDDAVIDVIDRSIAAGYQGIVWDWLSRSSAPGARTPSPMDTLRALHDQYEREGV